VTRRSWISLGHVSRQMLKHYSHIRMQAKRDALESIVKVPGPAPSGPLETVPDCELVLADAQRVEGESLQPTAGRVQKCGRKESNSLKRIWLLR
jgi:hypothetical protein